MRLGIFAKVFPRPTLEETLDAIAAHGLTDVQFNLSCVGLPTLPDAVDLDRCDRIAAAFQSRGLTMAAVSGTYNMIAPDPSRRSADSIRLKRLAEACTRLGTGVITLCTGTRDSSDMWRGHPGNELPDAWLDLTETVDFLLMQTEGTGVTLAFEPELANVVHSAAKARTLLDTFPSSRLKVVIDPANLFPAGSLPRMREVIDEAFQLLGRDIVLAHAKDLTADGAAGQTAAGKGALDYQRYLHWLTKVGYDGPLILHGLSEEEVSSSVKFLNEILERSDPLRESASNRGAKCSFPRG
jgi:sugar phosphate isomerase/epimerase